MRRLLHCRSLLAIAALLSVITLCRAQLPESNSEVAVTFQNTSTADLSLVVVDENEEETVVVDNLAAGTEVAVNSLPGNVWRSRLNGELFAEYEANENEEQVVDLALEASWKLPVEVDLQNDTEAPAELYLVNEQNQEVQLCAEVPPGAQWEQAGLATGSLLRIRQNNVLVAEYLTGNAPTQSIPLQTLSEDYAAQVVVTFQNTSTEPIDIFWIHPDGGVRLFHWDVPAGYQVRQPSFPGHVWVILQDGELVGHFVAGSAARQTVDVVQLSEQLLAAGDAILSGEARPGEEELAPAEETAAEEETAPAEEAAPAVEPRPEPAAAETRPLPGATLRERLRSRLRSKIVPQPSPRPTPKPPANGTTSVPQPPVAPNAFVRNPIVPPPAPNPLPAAPAMDSIVGHYQRIPVENDWHDLVITKVKGKRLTYLWTNKAGTSWQLMAEEGNPVLKTDASNPYFEEGETSRTIRLEYVSDDNGNPTNLVRGLTFLQGFYTRVGNAPRP